MEAEELAELKEPLSWSFLMRPYVNGTGDQGVPGRNWQRKIPLRENQDEIVPTSMPFQILSLIRVGRLQCQ
jgi:hypothetical protein